VFVLFCSIALGRAESILSLCERIGYTIDPTKVDADISDESYTYQVIAYAMANTRDRRVAGVTGATGQLWKSLPVVRGGLAMTQALKPSMLCWRP